MGALVIEGLGREWEVDDTGVRMAYITLHLLGGSRSLRLERGASSVREEVGMLAGISVAWIPLWLRSLCVSRPGDGCFGGNHMTRASPS